MSRKSIRNLSANVVAAAAVFAAAGGAVASRAPSGGHVAPVGCVHKCAY